MTYPAVADIDLNAFAANLARMRAASSASHLMAIVKADAYGHGIRPVAEALTEVGCRRFAVACLEEAVALRRVLREIGGDAAEADARYEMLILGYVDPADAAVLYSFPSHSIPSTYLPSLRTAMSMRYPPIPTCVSMSYPFSRRAFATFCA